MGSEIVLHSKKPLPTQVWFLLGTNCIPTMKYPTSFLSALLALGIGAVTAHAAVVYSENFNSSLSVPAGWTVAPGDFFGSPEGGVQLSPVAGNATNSFFLQASNQFYGTNAAGSVTVDTGVAYSSLNTYTLSFDYIGKDHPSQFYRDGTFTAQLWEGAVGGSGVLLGSLSLGDTTRDSSVLSSLVSTSASAGTGNVFLRFAVTSPSGTGDPDGFRQAMFDNVSLDAAPAPIPEPSSFAALTALAAFALAARRQRRA
jgi:hypothetical protein